MTVQMSRKQSKKQKPAFLYRKTGRTAISLYIKHGFEECETYYHNPMDDVIYMRKAL